MHDVIWQYDKDHRERLLPILRSYEKYLPAIEKGYYYAYGRDKSMNPVVYFDCRRWIDHGADVDELLTVMDIMQSFFIQNGLVPGHIENYHTIIDIGGVGYTEIPFFSLGKIVVHVRDGYFARNKAMFIINVPNMMKMAA